MTQQLNRLFEWVGTVVLALCLWGTGIEPRLIDQQEEDAYLPMLPPTWDGQRIALIGDLHVGMWLANVSTVRRIVRRLVADPPALVLIAGDFLYRAGNQSIPHIRHVVNLIRPLPAAGIPTYAVLGNHDTLVGRRSALHPRVHAGQKLVKSLASVGVTILRDEAIVLQPPNAVSVSRTVNQDTRLYLVGIEAHCPSSCAPVDALRRVPATAARLVMLHSPGSFPGLWPHTAPFAVAVHTHGGQIRIPGLSSIVARLLLKDETLPTDTGWIEGYGQPGNRLYINRGVGFSWLPARFRSPPELTVFTLHRASDGNRYNRNAVTGRTPTAAVD